MPPTVPLEQALAYAREIEALTDEVALSRISFARADGALADASSVPTGDLERGIRALTAERDGLKAELEVLEMRRGLLGNMLRYIAFVLAGEGGVMKPLKRCANGCQAAPQPPSKVLCASCFAKLDGRVRALFDSDGVRRGRGEGGE